MVSRIGRWIRTQVLKYLPEREGERGGSKVDVMGKATAKGAMEKSRYVRSLRGRRSEGMTQSNTS